MIYEFKIPAPKGKGNMRGHTRYINHAKKKYFEQCDLQILADKVKKPTKPIESVLWTAKVEVHSCYDEDNLYALMKWPLDWLQEADIIFSDGWYRCRSKNTPTQHMKRFKKAEKDKMRYIYLQLESVDIFES